MRCWAGECERGRGRAPSRLSCPCCLRLIIGLLCPHNKTGEPGVDDALKFKPRFLVSDATKMELETRITETVEVAGPRSHH